MSDSFLKEIGRSYIVSAFLPSAFFITLGVFLFHGFIPNGIVKQIVAIASISKYKWVVVTILILWSAFYLYSANNVTVRLFEGYFFPLKWIINKRTTHENLEEWEKDSLPEFSRWKRISQQVSAGVSITEEERNEQLDAFLMSLEEIAKISIQKPLDPLYQMPTRLGNVFRASEMHAFERYAILDIAFWPRLLPVLPPQITKHLEEKNNLFMFLLNSAFLSGMLAFISIFFGLIGMVFHLLNVSDNFFYIGYGFLSWWVYVGLSTVLITFGYVLYRVAVNSAEDFTMFIRVSYDLYRENLLHQLKWERPEKLEDERSLWLEISKLIVGGSRFETDFSSFSRYHQPEKTNTPELGGTMSDNKY